MKEAGDFAGLFCLQVFCSALHLSAVHQTNFMEPAKLRNIVDLLSLSGGQCKHPEEDFECLIAL
jgi:hypothetical protein